MPKVKDLLKKLAKFNPEAEIVFATHIDDEPYQLGVGEIVLESELPENDEESDAGVVLMENEGGDVVVYLVTGNELTMADYDEDFDDSEDDDE